MTGRIPLDSMTSDALDALYERLEAAEETETQRQLATAREAFASATTRAARAEADLAALRQVARGYCPACGRGDAAPTVQDWEQQRQRADQAEELLHLAHETSNKSETERARAVQRAEQAEAAHTETIDSMERVTRRAHRAEAALARVRAALQPYSKPIYGDRSRGFQMGWDAALQAIRAALDEPTNPPAEATEQEKTTRDLAALHRSAEDTVTRVINLHERWVKAGPPKLGTSMARWWDRRLAELHAAILNTAKEN